ncbi:MAG: helix-turn-helix transcriptional regulator [Alphaproteobacteria bacterium]|nr:helix-turn-helix transcriptional regulator [Alphaproteobacteria bacterium]
MSLVERLNKFLDEVGVPMTVVARKVGLSPQAIYQWKSGTLRLSDAAQSRIDEYLKGFNY